MPQLPLPVGGSYLAGGDLPVVTQADVNAVLPAFLHPDDPAIVRDAIFAALTQILLRYQQRSAFGLSMADVLQATGVYLAEACAERGIFKQAGETDEQLRARTLAAPSLVTPTAILAAVNAILAPFTAILPRYFESNFDRYYARSTNTITSPRSYSYNASSTSTSPDDASRGYPSEVSWNGGLAVVQREPGAMRVFSDCVGRYFVIRVPDLTSLNAAIAAVYQEPQASSAFYVGKGVSESNSGFVRINAATSTTVYQSICNVVNRIKGASMRWMLLVDPKLTS